MMMAPRFLGAALLVATTAHAGLPWQDVLVHDCTGTFHFAMGTPAETHISTPLQKWADVITEEARQRAQCVRNATCPSLTDEMLETLHVPGFAMVFNLMRPYVERMTRPAQCANGAGFASSFFSDTPVAGLGFDYFNLGLPASCTYERFMSGAGCTFTFTEAVGKTRVHAAVDRCPGASNTLLPYISLSIAGDWAANAFKPCSNVGTFSECGGATPAGGGAPLVCRTFSTNSDELWDAMKGVNLVGANWNSGGLSSCGDKGEMAKRIRTLINGAWGLPAPTDATAPIAFCLPSDDTLTAVKDWFSRKEAGSLQQYSDVDTVTSRTNAINRGNTAQCIANGCNLHSVGNGQCNMECYTPACRYDGGDCVSDFDKPPVVSMRGKNAACMITMSEASASGGVARSATEIRQNIWEECNGLGFCNTWSSSPYCSCPYDRQPSSSSSSSPKCDGFRQGPQCYFYDYSSGNSGYRSCQQNQSAVEYRLVGAAAALSAWNGSLPDGHNVLSADRKSGARWPMPSTWVDVGEASLSAGMVQVAHLDCSGAVGIRLGNDALAVGVYMPILMKSVADVYGWVKDVATCRAGSAGVSALTEAQHEVRFGVHHMALWAYQFMSLGPGLANQTLDSKWAAARGFGTRAITDFLPFAREPDLLNPTGKQLRESSWGKWDLRMQSPDATECSFDSIALGGASARGDRRCRMSYIDLGELSSVRGRRRVDVNVHMDARQDRCAGAGTGVGGETIMSSAAAAASLPSLGIYVESPLMALLTSPTFCMSDADCVGTGGGAFTCVNLVDTFIKTSSVSGMADALPAYLQDPLAIFTQGLRVDGSSQCANAGTFSRSARNIVRQLMGQPRESSSELKMCLPDLKGIADKAAQWGSGASTGCTGGTCLSVPAEPAEGYGNGNNDCTCRYPWGSTYCCPARAAGGPAVVAGFAPLAPNVPLAPGAVIAPDAADSLLSAASVDARSAQPGSTSVAFVASLVPGAGSRSASGGVTNVVKTKLRRGLSWALSRHGVGAVSTASIAITSVSAPGVGGAVVIGFTVSLPPGSDPSLAAAVRAELTGRAPGSVGANAGTYMSWMGVVNAADAGSVSIAAAAAAVVSSTPAPSLAPGALPSSSPVPPPATPSSTPAPSQLPTVQIFTVLTLAGVTFDQAINVQVVTELRRSFACNTGLGLPPSRVAVVSISDGRRTNTYTATDALNVVGSAACTPARRRRLAGAGADAAAFGGGAPAQRALQGASAGGNVTYTLRMSIPGDALPAPSPLPGQTAAQAQALAQANAANTVLTGTGNAANWLPPAGSFRQALASQFGVTPVLLSSVSTQSMTVPPPPASGGTGDGGGSSGSGSSSSTALAAGVGAGVGALLAVAGVAALVLYRRRGTPAMAGGAAAADPSKPVDTQGAGALMTNPMAWQGVGPVRGSGGAGGHSSADAASGRQAFHSQ